MCSSNKGYSAFDEYGTAVYTKKTSVPYHVTINIPDLNIYKGPGTDYRTVGKCTGKGTLTIIEVKSGKGSDLGWGRLKSGEGWIPLDFSIKLKKRFINYNKPAISAIGEVAGLF